MAKNELLSMVHNICVGMEFISFMSLYSAPSAEDTFYSRIEGGSSLHHQSQWESSVNIQQYDLLEYDYPIKSYEVSTTFQLLV